MTSPPADATPAGRVLPGAPAAPDWLQPLIGAASSVPLPGPLRRMTPFGRTRPSAVLVLLSDGTDPFAPTDGPRGPDVLMTARAGSLRSHGGQPAFPGGRTEPGEDAIATALREAREETGIDPAAVTPILQLDELFLGRSGHRVVPVVAHWDTPGPVQVVDPAETSAVVRIPVADLVDPDRRGTVRLSSGFAGPAFAVADLVIWGFTGLLLDAILDLGGWNRPWQPGRELQLPAVDAEFEHFQRVRATLPGRGGDR